METPDASTLVEELLAAFDTVGELERWVDQRMEGTIEQPVLNDVFNQVTSRLLSADPPDTAFWEQLVFATSVRSAKANGQSALEACRTAVEQLLTMIQSDSLQQVSAGRIVTLASALTLALTGQKKLRQPIEEAIGALGERFEHLIPDMAERCQDIWQRRGQMSGADSLFVWDTRHNVWRLHQDFKTYRPDA
jgi:hypothetical protein